MNMRIQELKTEIKYISTHWSQAIDEVDGLLTKAFEILNSFNSSSWNSLNNDLPKWENDELRILAETITTGNGRDVVEDNYTLGYIFTLTDNSTAGCILTNDIGDFLNENKVISFELLDKMKVKLKKMKEKKYLTEYEYFIWIKRFEEFKNKASR